jgi:tetratricopeptide (TPR) repeat protein
MDRTGRFCVGLALLLLCGPRGLAQPGEDETSTEDLIEAQIREGRFDDALAASDTLIAMTRDPYKAVVRGLRKGDIYQYQGEDGKALEIYAEALRQAGRGSWLENQICSQIARVFDRNNDPNGLQDTLEALVKAYPDRIGLKRRLAALLARMGQQDRSVALLKEVLDVTPGDRASQKAYAEALAAAGQLDRAITLLEQGSKAGDSDAETLIRLAELYHLNKQDDRVARCLDRFLDHAGRTEGAYLRAGAALERLALKDLADAVYRRMAADYPASLSARQDYAEFLCRSGRLQEALDLFRQIADKGDLQAMMRACDAAASRGRPDLALQWTLARAGDFSQDLSYLNHACRLAIWAKAWDSALTWARRCLDKAQTFPAVSAALSQVTAALDTNDRARRLMAELQALGVLTVQQACLLSELLESQGQPDAADKVLAGQGRVPQEILVRQQARLYTQRRDWIRAAAALEALASGRKVTDPDLIRELIDLYHKGQRTDDALRWSAAWEKAMPDSAGPRIAHSQLLDTLGRRSEAIDVLEAADRQFDGPADVLSPLASLYASRGRAEEAQRTYWRLYEITQDPAQKLRWIQVLSEAAGQSGGRDAVIERLRRQHQKDRSSAVPLLALAEVYKQTGQYEERRQALLEAAELQTDDVSLMHELSAVEEEQGDWEKAVQTLQKAMPRDTTCRTRLRLARLTLLHGDPEEGLRILAEVAGGQKMDPRDAEEIANSLLSTGSWEKAARFLKGLLTLYPQDYRLHYQYAVALEEAGQRQDALEAFVRLLGLREELPGNTTARAKFSWNRQGFDVDLQKFLPSQAVEVLRLSQRLDEAYSYRRDRMPAPFGGAAAPQPQIVAVIVPACVEDCRELCLDHILTLAQDRAEPQRTQVESDLAGQGIGQTSLLMKISKVGLPVEQTIDRLAALYPDDPTLAALWILQRMEGMGCTLQEAQRVFDLFEKTHPRLAASVGLRCTGSDPASQHLLKRSVELLRDIQDPGYYEVASIAHALESEAVRSRLTAEERDFLDTHLLGWYANIRKTGSGRVDIFNCVASVLAKRSDLTEYVKFLDDEIAALRNLPSSGPSYRPDQALLRPLPCPPRQIPDFPSHVLSVVLEGPQFKVWVLGRRDPADPARLGAYVDKARDPVLKILLAMASRKVDQAEALVTALMKTGQAPLASYVLAASLAGQRGQPQQTVFLLDKARSLATSQDDQRWMDAAMVSCAVDLDPNKDTPAVDLGRKAAIRLIRERLDPWQREELLVAVESLGLTEQAQSLRTQILASPGGTRPAAVLDADVAMIQRFLERGHTDSALRLASQTLMAEADRTLYPLLITGPPFSTEISHLIQLIRSHTLVDGLMERAAPPDAAPARQWAEYGRLCELLGNERNATAAYERALSQDANDPASRVQLALLASRTDPGRCAAHLSAIPRDRMATVGPGLARQVCTLCWDGKVGAALDLADGITAYLDHVGPATVNLDWVDGIAEAISEHCLYLLPPPTLPPGNRLFGFNRPVGSSSPSALARRSRAMVRGLGPMRAGWPVIPAGNPQLAERRRQVHDHLCSKMMDLPPLAEAGLSRLATEARSKTGLTDELAAAARKVLLTAKPGPTGPGPTPVRVAYVVNGQCFRLISPIEILVQHASETGTLTALVTEFVPQLRRAHGAASAEALEDLARLYTAPAPDFWTTADRFLAKSQPRAQVAGQPTVDLDLALQQVLEAYVARPLDDDAEMSRLVLDRVKHDVTQGSSGSSTAAMGWLQQLINRDRALAGAFLDAVIALYDSPGVRFSGAASMFRSYKQMLSQFPVEQTVSQPTWSGQVSQVQVRGSAARGRGTGTDMGRANRGRITRRGLP